MSKKKPKVGLIVTILIILGGFGYLMWGGLDNNLVYFLTPGELLARVRVDGHRGGIADTDRRQVAFVDVGFDPHR